jgi:hypothetical protein
MQHRSFYHGWLIELDQQSWGYSFQCWLPNEWLGVSDRVLYPSTTAALAAAQSRADLEAARLALEHCYSTFQQGELPYEDYLTLTDLILQLNLAAGDSDSESGKK